MGSAFDGRDAYPFSGKARNSLEGDQTPAFVRHASLESVVAMIARLLVTIVEAVIVCVTTIVEKRFRHDFVVRF